VKNIYDTGSVEGLGNIGTQKVARSWWQKHGGQTVVIVVVICVVAVWKREGESSVVMDRECRTRPFSLKKIYI